MLVRQVTLLWFIDLSTHANTSVLVHIPHSSLLHKFCLLKFFLVPHSLLMQFAGAQRGVAAQNTECVSFEGCQRHNIRVIREFANLHASLQKYMECLYGFSNTTSLLQFFGNVLLQVFVLLLADLSRQCLLQ